MRACNRRVLDQLTATSTFLPVLADRKGFRSKKVNIQQSPEDGFRALGEVYADSGHVHCFASCDSPRALRFFGMIGSVVCSRCSWYGS
jgi:hypothetical protein